MLKPNSLTSPHLLPKAQVQDLHDDEIAQEGHASQARLLEGAGDDGGGFSTGEQVAAAQLLRGVRHCQHKSKGGTHTAVK